MGNESATNINKTISQAKNEPVNASSTSFKVSDYVYENTSISGTRTKTKDDGIIADITDLKIKDSDSNDKIYGNIRMEYEELKTGTVNFKDYLAETTDGESIGPNGTYEVKEISYQADIKIKTKGKSHSIKAIPDIEKSYLQDNYRWTVNIGMIQKASQRRGFFILYSYSRNRSHRMTISHPSNRKK